MNSHPLDDRAQFASYIGIPGTVLSPYPIVVTILAGLVLLFKLLETLGYPVWLWLHTLLHMSQDLSPIALLRQLPGAFNSDIDEDSEHSEQGEQLSRPTHGANVLQTVFGLNGQSLINGVKGIKSGFSKSVNDVPPGLGNWDNSCYQNSIIQGLASLPSLRQYLHATTSEHPSLDKETTNGALFELIDTLNNPANNGQRFWIPAKLRAMSTFQQQDAQEYYSKILDSLDKEILKAADLERRSSTDWFSTAKSVMGDSQPAHSPLEPVGETPSNEPVLHSKARTNPLDGLLAQRVGCTGCGYSEGLSLIPFNCLTVPLGRNYLYDVRDCLDEYTNLEYIEGVECAKCTLLRFKKSCAQLLEKCSGPQRDMINTRLQRIEQALEDDDFSDNTLIKEVNVLKKNWTKTTKSRQAVIARAPKSLVIHVNRSVYDEYTGAQRKNHARVRFPKDLDLGSWCLGSRPSESHQCDESTEEWSKDPTKSMLTPTDADALISSPFQYTLRAAITHYGRHENGHYICYRKLPPIADKASQLGEPGKIKRGEESWWRLSDADVAPVPEEEVLDQGDVFMLFYERVGACTPRLIPTSPMIQSSTVLEDLPLPPSKFEPSPVHHDDIAIGVPLPNDEEEDLLSPPQTPVPRAIEANQQSQLNFIESSLSSRSNTLNYRHLTPMAEEFPEQGFAGYDSGDASSTQPTSDDDNETQFTLEFDSHSTTPSITPSMSPGPHRMRTAGQASGSGNKGRNSSLPMVAAT